MLDEPTPKETVRRVLAAWNTGDPGFVDRYYDESFTFERSTGAVTDRAGLRAVVEGIHEAFDDLSVDAHYLVAEGDRVVARVTVSGTHVGTFRDVEATGTDVAFDSVFLYRVVDGRIVHEEHRTDNLGLLEQIGAGQEGDAPA